LAGHPRTSLAPGIQDPLHATAERQPVLEEELLYIYGIYIAPLQGNYSEASQPGPGKKESLKETTCI